MSYSIDQLKAALVQADAAGDTQSAQILANQIAAQTASGYVKEQPEQEETIWTDLKHGAGELMDSWIHQGILASPATADLVAQSERAGIHPQGAIADTLRGANGVAALTPEPKTMTGKLVSLVPSMAAAIPGWEAGLDALGETALPEIASKLTGKSPALEWVTDKAIKGIAGTLGSDITTGENPDNALAGGVGNVFAEAVFHTPKGLRLISAIIQQNDAEIMAAADHIGVTPTAAMATARKWIPTLTDMASKMPGGNLIGSANQKVLAGLEAFSEQVKRKMGYKGDSTGLGESIREALANYVKKFDTDTEAAYEKVMKNAGLHQMTNTRRFVRKVQELGGLTERAGLDKMTVPPIVRRYMDYIEQAGNKPQNNGYGNVPMTLTDARRALKILDDYIGTGENATADAAAAKQMASALREDIGGTFAALGLGEQWQAVQSNYARQLGIIERAEKTLLGANTGDEVYRRLFGNPWEGFKPLGRDTIAALKPVMGSDVMNSISAEVLHRMGLEGTGAASAEGRAFSPSLYLTNWNKLNDAGAVESLFSAAERNDIDALAKVSEGIKRAGKSVNHSNTASHAALWGMISAAIMNPVHGVPALAAVAGGNTLLSLVLTHPQAARLLSTAEGDAARGWIARTLPKLLAISAAHDDIRQAFENAIGGDDSEN
ncbi:hypothetical protein ACSLOU_00555 [Enterobacter cloacae]|uniref:hypothetical protein n=1 Tax=Enterobacter cloacae TaxID=550 RepID=UPI003EE33ECE